MNIKKVVSFFEKFSMLVFFVLIGSLVIVVTEPYGTFEELPTFFLALICTALALAVAQLLVEVMEITQTSVEWHVKWSLLAVISTFTISLMITSGIAWDLQASVMNAVIGSIAAFTCYIGAYVHNMSWKEATEETSRKTTLQAKKVL